MISIHTIGDICQSVKEKIHKTHGGTNILGCFIFLNKKGKEEYKRVMALKYSKIIEYIK